MAERTIASVLKTVEALRSPGVRIPLSPPSSEAALGRSQFVFDPLLRVNFGALMIQTDLRGLRA